MSNHTETSYQKNKRAYVSLEHLYLDPNNYRFIDNEKYVKVEDASALDPVIQRRTRGFILGKNNEEVDDLLRSLKNNGYLDVDQIQVREIKEGVAYLVVEGNRRAAALKLLQEELERGNDIGQLDPVIFSKVPVVVSAGLDRSHYKILMGLKHISGNKKWPAVNQAELLRSLRGDGLSEQEIKDALGISTVQLRRYLRVLALIDAYKVSDYGDQFRTEMFNIFSEVIKQPKIMTWLGWDEETYQAKGKENLNRLFSWVSRDESEDEEEVMTVMDPILSRGNDLRELAAFIDDEKALLLMEETRSITEVTLSSDRFSTSKFENTLDSLDKQLLAAIDFSRYATPESKDRLPDLKRKFDALLAAQERNDLFVPAPIFGEVTKSGNAQRDIQVKIGNSGYSEVLVERYKVLQGVKIPHLSRINIFAGTNNSGKSTLLEAIYALTVQNDVDNLADLLRRRGKFANEMPALWLNRQFDHEAIVSGIFFGKPAQTRIFKDREDEDFKTGYLNTLFVEASFERDTCEGRLRLFENRMSESFANPIVNICNTRYSTPFAIHNQEDLLSAFEQSVIGKSKDAIVHFLQEQVDKGILTIEQAGLNGLQRFYVNHENLGEAADLTQFGDGVQRIFHIALQFAACKNGVLLIDEIENAIHHSLFAHFVRLVQDLSEQFQVQVFITSHSKECIDAFFGEGADTSKISAYRLVRSEEGQVECLYEEGARYGRLIQNFDADLRS
ncbi:MAG: AAA family ATPase [Saprospiraceae bacterium]